MKNQKLWDRAGLYGIVVSAILSWFVLQYIYTLISGFIPSGGASAGQLNEIKNNLENSLGN